MTLTFSASAKAEICKNIPQKKCCAISECFGILLFSNCFSAEKIRIVSESRDFAQLLPKLFKKAFGLSFDTLPEENQTGKLVFQILDGEKIRRIMDAFGFDKDTVSLQLNMPIVEEECCKASFLRGAFLAGGSVTDPSKGYHVELATTHQAVARQVYGLMEDSLGFYPKLSARGSSMVLYIKQSDKISDFLTYLGAPVAGMGIIEAKLEKELNNKVNRRCNCDDANISKVVDAAQEQLSAIAVLRQRGIVSKLPDKLRQAAEAREKNPEATLTELAAMMRPPISKPAMNHRLKRLVEMAKEDSV